MRTQFSDFFFGYLRGYIFILGMEKRCTSIKVGTTTTTSYQFASICSFLRMGPFGFVQTFKGHFGPRLFLHCNQN